MPDADLRNGKILVLADGMTSVSDFEFVRGAPEEQRLHFLVARNPRVSVARFFVGIVKQVAFGTKGRRRSWLASTLGAGRLHVRFDALDSIATRQWIYDRGFALGLHAAGIIYRRPLIEAFKLGILNAHIGMLPKFRGRSVLEWTIIEGDEPAITTFFIDEGIDTGARIVRRRKVDLRQYGSLTGAKNAMFALASTEYISALREMLSGGELAAVQKREEGKRYYEMSALLRSVVDDVFNARFRDREART